MKPYSILIVGGGIAGLTLAAALVQRGQAVEIVERTPEWKPVGSGIMLHANAVAVLTALGLSEQLAQRGHPMPEMQVTDRNGRHLTTLNLNAIAPQLGPSYTLHRADLHDILLTACQDATIHLGESVTSLVQQSDGVEVTFTSGRTGRYGLVVGADGLHSRVRELAFAHEPPQLAYSGYTCWRFVAENRDGLTSPIEMWGRGARFGLVPLRNGRLYVYMTQNAPKDQSDPSKNRHEWVATQFADFGSVAQSALSQLSAKTTLLRHDLTELADLTWGNGRIALVGDAAHAMTPNMGQGAAQAIEGALALAIALEQTADIPTALARYQEIHAKRVKIVHGRSRLIGQMGQWSNNIACSLRDFVARITPASAAETNLRKLLTPGVTLAREVKVNGR